MSVPPRQTLTIRASRETVVLLVAVTAMTLAIGHGARNRPAAAPAAPGDEQSAAGGWTGQLADLAQPAPAVTDAAAAPLSSDALTLPKAALALPVPPKTPAAAPVAGAKGPPAKAVTATPARRPSAAKPVPRIEQANLMQRLNPLNHIPDAVKRPFAWTGETVVGWVRRF